MKNCLMYKMSYYRFDEIDGYDRVRNQQVGVRNIKFAVCKGANPCLFPYVSYTETRLCWDCRMGLELGTLYCCCSFLGWNCDRISIMNVSHRLNPNLKPHPYTHTRAAHGRGVHDGALDGPHLQSAQEQEQRRAGAPAEEMRDRALGP